MRQWANGTTQAHQLAHALGGYEVLLTRTLTLTLTLILMLTLSVTLTLTLILTLTLTLTLALTLTLSLTLTLTLTLTLGAQPLCQCRSHSCDLNWSMPLDEPVVVLGCVPQPVRGRAHICSLRLKQCCVADVVGK